MKIGWWAEVSLAPSKFVMGTPSNHVPLLRRLEALGHEVVALHVPWKYEGKYVLDDPEWMHVRDPGEHREALDRRQNLERVIKTSSGGVDVTERTVKDAAEVLEQELKFRLQHDELRYDRVFMKLPPPGFLKQRIETAYALALFSRSCEKVIAFDGDLILASVLEMAGHMGADWSRVELWLPYPKVDRVREKLPSGAEPLLRFKPYFYDELDELVPNELPQYDLGYIGSDWKREGSPRCAGLAEFYVPPLCGNRKHPPGETCTHGVCNRIWGRWTEENIVETGLPRDWFRGPVPSEAVRDYYKLCRASVVIALPKYYPLGLVTQRYREILQGGALLLIDARYAPEVTREFVPDVYRVDDHRGAYDLLRRLTPENRVELVHEQRKHVRGNERLSVDGWVSDLLLPRSV